MKKSGWPTTSRHARGYGNDWDKTRKEVLRRDNGLCQCSECQGGKVRTLVATEVHHVVSKAKARQLGWSKEQTESMNNLISINEDCHKRETAAENGYQLKPKIKIGEDGWPE